MRTVVLLTVLGGSTGCHALLPLGSGANDGGIDASTADSARDLTRPPDAPPAADAPDPDGPAPPPLILATADNTLRVLDLNGEPQHTAIPIPYGVATRPLGEDARDLVRIGASVAVYNGTFSPYLSVYDPSTNTWGHHTLAGWSTANNTSYGGVTAWGSFVYATDMATNGDPSAGVVRFSVPTWSAARHGTNGYIDVNMGLDGKLYALRANGTTVDLFDPQTMAASGSITLPVISRALAVNAKGEIFAATWSGEIVRVAGSKILTKRPTHLSGLVDIDLDHGVLVASSAYGGMWVTNESLVSAKQINLTSTAVFVSLVPSP